MFNLPHRWVFVFYEDGTRENVANQDTLSAAEARALKFNWEKWRNKKVIAVMLLAPDRETAIKAYYYDGNGLSSAIIHGEA